MFSLSIVYQMMLSHSMPSRFLVKMIQVYKGLAPNAVIMTIG